eukprot:591610-Prymnesium_polylepis.2
MRGDAPHKRVGFAGKEEVGGLGLSISRTMYSLLWWDAAGPLPVLRRLAPLWNAAVYAFSMSFERAALIMGGGVAVALTGRNFFFPHKPQPFHDSAARYARVSLLIQLAFLALAGPGAIAYLFWAEVGWQRALSLFPNHTRHARHARHACHHARHAARHARATQRTTQATRATRPSHGGRGRMCDTRAAAPAPFLPHLPHLRLASFGGRGAVRSAHPPGVRDVREQPPKPRRARRRCGRQPERRRGRGRGWLPAHGVHLLGPMVRLALLLLQLPHGAPRFSRHPRLQAARTPRRRAALLQRRGAGRRPRRLVGDDAPHLCPPRLLRV